jgi:hypothetical protein
MTQHPERLSDFTHTVLHLESMVSTYLVEMDQDKMLKFSKELATRYHSNVQPKMVMDILAVCPEFKSTIYPNLGGKLVTFSYGLEGSRVLYVTINKNNFLHIPSDDPQWDELRKWFESIGKAYNADESWEIEDSPFAVTWRYWWD